MIPLGCFIFCLDIRQKGIGLKIGNKFAIRLFTFNTSQVIENAYTSILIGASVLLAGSEDKPVKQRACA
jgi:hypothetical protein